MSNASKDPIGWQCCICGRVTYYDAKQVFTLPGQCRNSGGPCTHFRMSIKDQAPCKTCRFIYPRVTRGKAAE